MKIKEAFSSERDPKEVPLEWHLERFRNWRNKELLATDWTQIEDSPANKVAYANYRQLLRDLPSLTDFANVELPIKP